MGACAVLTNVMKHIAEALPGPGPPHPKDGAFSCGSIINTCCIHLLFPPQLLWGLHKTGMRGVKILLEYLRNLAQPWRLVESSMSETIDYVRYLLVKFSIIIKNL